MNLPQIFMYQGAQVRTVMKNGEPWFVLKDLCEVLEIDQVAGVKRRLSDDVISNHPIPDALGRIQETAIVNEDGMYDVVLESRKEEARAFRKWITSEVLPSIRKTGSYGVNRLPQNYVEALEALVQQVKENQLLEAQIEENRPKVALYDTAMSAGNNFTMERVAKTLGYGRNKLFEFLREMKILRSNNLPYQEYLDRGYFDVRQYSITHYSSGIENKNQTLVTPKGMAYIHRLLVEHGKIPAA